jgi:hypothetical protein
MSTAGDAGREVVKGSSLGGIVIKIAKGRFKVPFYGLSPVHSFRYSFHGIVTRAGLSLVFQS